MHTSHRRVTARQCNHTQPPTRGAKCNLPSVSAWHNAESRMQLVHPNHRPAIDARVGSRQVQIIPRRGAKIHTRACVGSGARSCQLYEIKYSAASSIFLLRLPDDQSLRPRDWIGYSHPILELLCARRVAFSCARRAAAFAAAAAACTPFDSTLPNLRPPPSPPAPLPSSPPRLSPLRTSGPLCCFLPHILVCLTIGPTEGRLA